MNGDHVVHWSISRHHNYLAGHDRTMSGFDPGFSSALNFRRVRLAKQSAAVTNDRACQTIKIFERMKLRLAWKPQRCTGIERMDRRACYFFNGQLVPHDALPLARRLVTQRTRVWPRKEIHRATQSHSRSFPGKRSLRSSRLLQCDSRQSIETPQRREVFDLYITIVICIG
jgi:hypothetical protein